MTKEIINFPNCSKLGPFQEDQDEVKSRLRCKIFPISEIAGFALSTNRTRDIISKYRVAVNSDRLIIYISRRVKFKGSYTSERVRLLFRGGSRSLLFYCQPT